jgi:hypothetical protein
LGLGVLHPSRVLYGTDELKVSYKLREKRRSGEREREEEINKRALNRTERARRSSHRLWNFQFHQGGEKKHKREGERRSRGEITGRWGF